MTNERSISPAVQPFGLHELAEAFFRHKKKAAFFVLLVGALATLTIIFAPRKFTSEARLHLQVGRESVRLDPTATTGQTIALQQSGRDNEVTTAMDVLKSRSILELTVDRLTPEVILGEAGEGKSEPNPVADAVLMPVRYAAGLIRGIDPISKREEAIILIERNFTVDAEHSSTVISLSYDAETSALAQHVLSNIVEVYREEHVRMHQTDGSRPFFQRQRDELEQQLVSAENALRDAKNRMGFASIDGRRGTLEVRLGSIEQNRNATVQAIAAAKARVAALNEHIAAMPERMHTSTTVGPNSGADALRSQLYALQVALMNLEAKYNPDHPLVASTRAQVEEARRLLQQEDATRETTVDSVNDNQRALELALAQSESELAGSEAQLSELNEQRLATQADLKRLNDFEVELQELERVATLARTNFYGYAKDLEEARVDEELDRQRITNVVIAQMPTLTEKPSSPSKFLIVAMSLALATAGTTVLVVGSEKLGSRLHAEEQIEQWLRLPVLATVPEGRAFASVR